ncbi:ABC transporter permease, partial [Sphingopyxis sp.]|uniref:ABC transporter permease n=1 Tax=Sphingopyxis sp. TaxID=1908224 RepID=UPI00311E69AA
MIGNVRGIRAIYMFEMARFGRTVWTSLMLPVITTTLYFVVFGSAIGSRMSDVSSVPYGAFIVPGLMMLTMFTESISNASFGIYMPKWTGTIYEMLSSPMSPLELLIAYVGAAATKSVIIGAIIFATAHLFVDIQVAHPVLMVGFMVLMAVTFCLFGFIIGIWAQSFEQLQVIPLLVVYPLTFLGGAFYSLDMLPAAWRAVTLFNPDVNMISGFRWTFFGQGDVAIE